MERPDLTPAIVQDADTGRVLMLAYMDGEALRRTRESGEAWFWSRSRQEHWHKGATSGNTLAVEELRDDCDGDAILLRVRPAGPACHTGSESCFAPWLWRVVSERAKERPEGSYVVSLLDEGAGWHAGIQRWVRDLLGVYRREPSLYRLDHDPAGFEWIDCSDHESSVYSFVRRGREPGDHVVMVFNFTPVVRRRYRIGVPERTTYIELLNSDSKHYRGGDAGNGGAVAASAVPAHGRPASVSLTLPPLGCLLLKPSR